MKVAMSRLGLGVACVVPALCCFVSVRAEEVDTSATKTVEVEKPAMVTRDQWGSDPLPIPDSRRHIPKYITLHHAGVTWTAGSDPYEKVRNLQAWGKKPVEEGGKDWPDLPYHYLIAPDGTIFEGRPTEYEPETNTNYDVHGHIGIQLFGNFEVQRVSPQQLASAVRLVAWLAQEFDVPDQWIRGHRDVADNTDCPGRDFYRYIENGRLVDWVRQLRQGKTPAIDPGPALDGGPTEMIPLPDDDGEIDS